MGAVKKILVLGGTRSGKSRFAEELLGSSSVLYVATSGRSLDEEFNRRVLTHQRRRPVTWETVEIDGSTESGLQEICHHIVHSDRPVLVESLGSVSMGLLGDAGGDDVAVDATISDSSKFERACGALAHALAVASVPVVIVSEEVGLAPHPLTEVGRRYVDLHGSVNQEIASHCDQVFFVVAGQALTLSCGEIARSDLGLKL